MDCEKLEAAMMDELYGELDEVTSAAVKRHLAGCTRCAALLGGLKATRRVAAISLVAPPAGLEERVLLAARATRPSAPPRRRLASAISLAGSWAMRPQTAMAALFLVMIGISGLLLRGRSSRAPASAEVTVTEEGTPAPVAAGPPPAEPSAQLENQPSTPPPAPARARPAEQKAEQRYAAAPVAPAAPADALHAAGANAMAESESVSPPAPAGAAKPAGAAAAGGAGAGGAAHDDHAAPPAAAKVADTPASADPAADLRIARSLRDTRGCRAALAKFDQVAQRAAGTRTGWDALLEGAKCYAATGDVDGARARLSSLLQVDLYRDAARAQLDRLDRGY